MAEQGREMSAPKTGETILIIDDDSSLRKVVKLRLEWEGYHVLTAEDGEQGLQLAKAEQPHVILLDILMPKMDGREALRGLKADPNTRDIPVILLTVIGQNDELYTPLGTGHAFHLSKPYNSHELLEKIRQVLLKEPNQPPHRPSSS